MKKPETRNGDLKVRHPWGTLGGLKVWGLWIYLEEIRGVSRYGAMDKDMYKGKRGCKQAPDPARDRHALAHSGEDTIAFLPA